MEFGRERMEGVLRGAVGSVAGLAAMGLFFRAAQALSERAGNGAGDGRSEDFIERHHALDDISVVGDQTQGDENATEAVGRIGYETVTGHDPDEKTKQRLGQAVHWGYGILLGGLYGALREDADAPDLLGGLGYGTAAWIIGDEVMVPLLGLAEGPTAHGWTVHARALGAHLVYGAATSSATQALKRVM
jgi:putative membrane protein